MRNTFNFADATQQAFGFLRQELSIVEPGVYRTVFPEVQYPGLVPVDTGGWEWAKSITFTSLDSVGRAQWFHSQARDVPVAEVQLNQFETRIEMAAIGYRYGIEEVQTALRLGIGITNEKAMAAKRAYEEFVDDVVLRGNTAKGWYGLINQPSDVATIDAADVGDLNGGTNSSYWAHKDVSQIMDDFNAAITNVTVNSLQVELADTVLLPLQELTRLAQMQMTNLPSTVLGWIQQHNMYTLQTGRPLNIKAIRGLETADDAGGGRMVVYRNDPGVLKFHIPMPHKFLPVQPENPVGLVFLVPGIFRLGGLEIRRPAAMRYVDGISAPPV
jgi:hypothetical protein